MKSTFNIALYVFFIYPFQFGALNAQNVTIPELGTFLGTTAKTAWTSKIIYQFLGIKYAESPSGFRRFKAPVAKIQEPGIHNAQHLGLACPSIKMLDKFTKDDFENDPEDCLSLCIHSGNLTGNHPVMVQIPGGGFINGSALNYPPHYLLERDIVFVVVQYRLGPFGFLSTHTEDIPGNVGVLDVIFALKWIQTYIKHFGGDPQQITLVGHSSGAVIVSTLLYSPAVPIDLFHKAIIQSGSFFGSWSFDLHPKKRAYTIGKYCNCKTDGTEQELNECYMKLSVVSLLECYRNYYVDLKEIAGGSRLTVGGPSNNVLPLSPYEMVRNNARVRNIPVMVGASKQDGSYAVETFYDKLSTTFDFNSKTFNTFHLIDEFTNFLEILDYTGSLTTFLSIELFTYAQMIEGNFTNMIPGLVDVSSIGGFKAPALRLVQTQAELYPNNTYLYSFDYEGEFSFHPANASKYQIDKGVSHSDISMYLFPYPAFASKLNKQDNRMAKTLVDLWTSFATTGVPTTKRIPYWPPVTKISGPYLHINKESSIGEDFLDEYSVNVREHNSASIIKPFLPIIFATTIILSIMPC